MANYDALPTGRSRTQKFSLNQAGWYALSLTASCKRKEDLRVEIDRRSFREIPTGERKQKFNIPPAWNGAKLQGGQQKNIFVIYLEAGEHRLTFEEIGEPEVTEFTQQLITDLKKVELNLETTLTESERQPWLNIILVNLPLQSVTARIAIAWHPRDGDDVKLIIDGQIKTDNTTNWLWHATPDLKNPTIIRKSVNLGYRERNHYLEFWTDQTPTIHQIILDLTQGTSESFIGDFECQAVEKLLSNGKIEKLLGIKKVGREGKKFDPNVGNTNYELYFNGEKQPVGKDLKWHQGAAVRIQFDLSNAWADEDDWFYFGIDTTFLLTHGSNWKKSALWSVYEK